MPKLNTYVSNRQGKRLHALPEANVQTITDNLYKGTSATISMAQTALNADKIEGLSKEIQVWEELSDGTEENVFVGVVDTETGDINNCTFNCLGLESLFGRRIIDDATLTYTDVDQLYIATQLIIALQSEATQANRDYNIDFATYAMSGKIRRRIYLREEHKTYLELLQEFPGLDDGFDWAIHMQPDGARWWTPYYPKRGSFKPHLALQITDDGTRGITNFSYSRSWQKLATHVYVTGGASNGVKKEQNYEDVAASVTYDVSQTVLSEGSQEDLPWLLDKAKRSTDERKKPVFQPTITVGRTPIDYRRVCDVGDTIPVHIDRGRAQVLETKRVAEKKWNIKEDTIDLTFESAEVT